jgi:hypothetical protein
MFLAGLKNLRRPKPRLLEAAILHPECGKEVLRYFGPFTHDGQPSRAHQIGQKNAISGVPTAITTSESGSPSRQ